MSCHHGRQLAFLQVLNTEDVVREVQPIILDQLHHGALPARNESAAVLALSFQESLSGGKSLGELYRLLILDFFAGASYWQRTGFLLFCKAALGVLSNRLVNPCPEELPHMQTKRTDLAFWNGT